MMLQNLSFSLWLIPVLSFYTAFLRQSSYFFSLTRAMVGNSSALLLLSVLRHCLQFGLECIWPGKSRHCVCMGEGGCQQRMHESDWHFSDTHLGPDRLYWAERWILANGRVEPQTVDFYTTDHILFYCQIIMIILANFTKKIVTDNVIFQVMKIAVSSGKTQPHPLPSSCVAPQLTLWSPATSWAPSSPRT